MKKYMMIFTLLSLLPIMALHSECSICLSQDLPDDNNGTNEATVRGQKCKCFCSLSVTEDATVSNDLTVDGNLTGGNITTPGGRVDGQLTVNGSDVNALFNVAQYFFIPETTRACTAPNQSVAANAAIAFPTGTVSGTNPYFIQISPTTFIISPGTNNGSLPNQGYLTFIATIQLDPSTTNATISAVGTFFAIPSPVASSIATVTQSAGQSQITITGSADASLKSLQFINQGSSSACITTANVKFNIGYYYSPPVKIL